MFRYADDLLICCQYQSDAKRIRKAMSQRLLKFKLKLNEEKTHEVLFSKRAARQGSRQGTFDFLGFTFYLGTSRNGKYIIPKLKSSGKRITSKLKNVAVWMKRIRNRYPLRYIWRLFCSKLRGHIQYYGVSFNAKGVGIFLDKAKRIFFKWINRRSQRKSFNWEKFGLYEKRFPLPKIKVHHKLF
jgi:RNA-directed DNA polymerase